MKKMRAKFITQLNPENGETREKINRNSRSCTLIICIGEEERKRRSW